MPPNRDYLDLEQPVMGYFIRELRQMLGLTQEKFAAQLGVTFPTINRWENGHAVPSPLALRQVSQLLSQLDKSPDPVLRQRSQALQAKYFAKSFNDTPHEPRY